MTRSLRLALFLVSLLAPLCLPLRAVSQPIPPGTNPPTALSLLLPDRAVMNLTASLQQYANPPKFTGKFTSLGSGGTTILVNRWATEFGPLYPDIQMEIHGGGSADALPALLAGTVDLVPMSRPLPAEASAQFKKKFGYEPAQILVAQDALAIYVNKNNPLTGLTLAQLDAIYSREDRRGASRPEFWSDLGVTGPLADQLINRSCLISAFGANLYFRDFVMQGSDYRFDVHFEPVPSSLVQAVGADDAGIGFVSIMFATARTRFVPVQAEDGHYLLPTYENTQSGQYPLVRPLRIIFNRKPDGTMNPAAREFLRFAVSRRGQRLIALAGAYPLTSAQQQTALQTLAN